MPILLLALILGLVQAITEFLPVSSSAHLILARQVLDFNVVDGLTFDVALHIGTLIATVVYFWADLRAMAKGFFTSLSRHGRPMEPMERLAWYVLAACVPAGLVGYQFEHAIELYFRHPGVIVVSLILGSLLMLWVEKRFSHDGDLQTLTVWESVIIGFSQVLALVPGVSRSGITIATGMMCRLRREEAARFSFLMAAPITFGAALKKSVDLFTSGQPITPDERTALIAGIVASGLGGWLVIRFLLSFLKKHGIQVFAYYRIVLAVLVLVFLVF